MNLKPLVFGFTQEFGAGATERDDVGEESGECALSEYPLLLLHVGLEVRPSRGGLTPAG